MAARGQKTRVYTGRQVTVDFLMDWEGIARCAQGPELTAACESIATNRALPYAIRISPRSNRHDPTHRHYQDQFVIKTGTTVINDMRRVAVRLWNMSDHATIVEWGDRRTPAYRVLGRTVNYLNGPVSSALYTDVIDARRRGVTATEHIDMMVRRRGGHSRRGDQNSGGG